MRTKKEQLFLAGDGICLRKISLADADGNYLKWLNDRTVNQYLESRFTRWTGPKIREYIKKYSGDPGNLLLAVILKDSGEHIGNIKIGPINRIHKSAEIGIIIGEKNCWGKGFASEAIRLITDYAFNTLKLHKLTAGAYAENLGSVKAFKKAGFKIEGLRKKHVRYGRGYTDLVLMGRLKR
jgi:[ribosomal protein S5]-alanine N-acetyltransferase